MESCALGENGHCEKNWEEKKNKVCKRKKACNNPYVSVCGLTSVNISKGSFVVNYKIKV